MSKGHMEALAALKARRPVQVVTIPARVTKPVTKTVTAPDQPKGGRPRLHGSAAEKQQAYRDRKKTKA